MSSNSSRTAIAGALLALLALSGCGKIVEAASERAIEAAIEAETGEDIDLDLDFDDDGSFKIEADGETIEFDVGDETLEITGSDDGGESNFTMGEGLPEDWPSSVPVPDGTVVAGSSINADGERLWTVSTTPDDVIDSFDSYIAQLEKAGYEVTSNSNYSSDGTTNKSALLTGEYNIVVSGWADASEDSNVLGVNVGTE
ncbi:MAG: hypothetical protein V3V01_05145 [Acidimicrobiales bacterium]